VIERVSNRNFLEFEPEHVLEVYRSINENLASVEGHAMQMSTVTIVGARHGQKIGLFLHYWLTEDRLGVVYRETDPLTPKNYAQYRDEALASCEAMGFILDNAGYRSLSEEQRKRLVADSPAFGGGPAAEPVAVAESEADGAAAESEPTTAEFDADDPETILVLEEQSEQIEAPHVPSGEVAMLGNDQWTVFFRLMASL